MAKHKTKHQSAVAEPTEKQAHLLQELEKVAAQLGVEVRVMKSDGKGGMCRWRDQWILVLDRALEPAVRIEVMAEELARFDTSGVFAIPAVRELLDRCRDPNQEALAPPRELGDAPDVLSA